MLPFYTGKKNCAKLVIYAIYLKLNSLTASVNVKKKWNKETNEGFYIIIIINWIGKYFLDVLWHSRLNRFHVVVYHRD